ncbi:MAG: hypothetical protein IJ584_08270 [Bacteroidales bacterium]|nr:hypothetical protein [Bacteroidales bacterium]
MVELIVRQGVRRRYLLGNLKRGMMDGWIKIYRKMLDWEWYKDVSTKGLFLHLLLIANSNAVSWRGIEIKRGQILTSRLTLAAETGLSEGQVKRSLQKLKASNDITTKATNKYTIITLCNYESYQSFSTEADQQTDQQSDQQTDHKQEEKKKRIDSFKKETPKGVKKEISSNPASKKTSPQPPSLVMPFGSPEFARTWETLREQPKWKGKTANALQMSLNKLGRYDEAFAIGLMEDAIERGWQGVVFSDTDEKYRQWKEKRAGAPKDKNDVNALWNR